MRKPVLAWVCSLIRVFVFRCGEYCDDEATLLWSITELLPLIQLILQCSLFIMLYLGSTGMLYLGSIGMLYLGSIGMLYLESIGKLYLGSIGMLYLASIGMLYLGSIGMLYLGSIGMLYLGSTAMLYLGSIGMLYLGSIGMLYLGSIGIVGVHRNAIFGVHRNAIFGVYRNVKRVTKGQFYIEILGKWPFSYNFFVKFHDKNNWEQRHDCVISKSMLYIARCVIKGLHCI